MNNTLVVLSVVTMTYYVITQEYVLLARPTLQAIYFYAAGVRLIHFTMLPCMYFLSASDDSLCEEVRYEVDLLGESISLSNLASSPFACGLVLC